MTGCQVQQEVKVLQRDEAVEVEAETEQEERVQVMPRQTVSAEPESSL